MSKSINIWFNPKSTQTLSFSFTRYFSLFLITILILISSCTTQKQLTYLQGIDEAGPDNIYPYSRPDYKLQKQDILYIDIETLNPEINLMLNPSGDKGATSISQSQGSGYLIGNSLNDSGFITLPVVGDIYVLGKTMEEATKAIEEKTFQMFKDAKVIVKLLTYNITILGEVNSPGRFVVYADQLTVFDALGKAGDLTEFGNRSNVLVIRSTNEGSKTYRVNLKDPQILIANSYFLLPNDIVIVEPLRVKFFAMNAQTFALFITTIFSTVSLTILVLNINK